MLVVHSPAKGFFGKFIRVCKFLIVGGETMDHAAGMVHRRVYARMRRAAVFGLHVKHAFAGPHVGIES